MSAPHPETKLATAPSLMERGLIPILLVGCVIALFLSCLLGSTPLPPDRVFAAFFGGADIGDRLVVWSIRLPRALAAFLVGAALGLSGAALQGLLRNPLAEPGVLGVSASASLAATFSIYYGLVALSPWALPLAAIIGALGATALLALAAIRTQSVITLILIGVGLSSFAGALMSLMMASTSAISASSPSWAQVSRPVHRSPLPVRSDLSVSSRRTSCGHLPGMIRHAR